MNLTVTPIGTLESCYLDKFGTPRQPGLVPMSFGRIKILPEWQPADSLQGLEAFSHIWVLFHFNQNQVSHFHAKVHPPRMGGEKIGVFATRSPHRPNPIGLSLVKLEKIEKNFVYISGIDIVDGTPVLDIKPYLNYVESIPDAVSGWVQNKAEYDIEVIFPDQAQAKLDKITKEHPEYNFKELVVSTLKLDPRPTVYKGYESEKNSPYRQSHAVRIIQYDVHFEFISKQQIQVVDIINL
jgi:tRNA (adenine37-N6)-methyltransferase